MNRRLYLFLALLGLGSAALVAVFQSSPGYMDADYYYMGGLNLANRSGFIEQILWNYLDDPTGLPHPSHGYWMPLASLLATLGMLVTGSRSFPAARLCFVILAACLPPLTAHLSFKLIGRRDAAIFAGLLVIFSGFYLAYFPTIDTFGLYMLLGALFFEAAWLHVCDLSTAHAKRSWGGAAAFALGVLAGLMHLARADGLVWLGWALLVTGAPGLLKKQAGVANWHPARAALALAGYAVVMGPWMARNFSVFGTLLAPGGARALWLTDYDELYMYPAAVLTPARWWASGLGAILQARLSALGMNLQTALAVQGEVFLLPLILAGMWRLRQKFLVRLGGLAWLLTFGIMTFVFPFAGSRGGFFHSGAALQPFFWAIAPAGLDLFIEWGGLRRGWNVPQARAVFRTGLLGFALLMTVFTFWNRVIGSNETGPVWDKSASHYAHLEQELRRLGAQPQDRVLVNNAPGYYLASGRPALSIPFGELDSVLAVAQRYQAQYLLLEIDQIKNASDLFQYPSDRPGLQYLTSLDGTHIFRFPTSP